MGKRILDRNYIENRLNFHNFKINEHSFQFLYPKIIAFRQPFCFVLLQSSKNTTNRGKQHETEVIILNGMYLQLIHEKTIH